MIKQKKMNKLTKYKLILSISPSLFFLVGMFLQKNTFDFYMYLIVSIVFPIISWFVIQYSLKQYGKELEKNRNKNTNKMAWINANRTCAVGSGMATPRTLKPITTGASTASATRKPISSSLPVPLYSKFSS